MERHTPACGRLRIIAAVMAAFLFVAALVIRQASAQPQGTDFYASGPVTYSNSAEICHVIKNIGQSSLAFYGVHATNTSGSTVYLAIFPNQTTIPNNGTVIPGGGWAIAATSDRDVNTVDAAVPTGAITSGFMVCFSTTQGTFTAATGVGYFWALYKGLAATPTATATATPSPTPT